MGWISRWKIVDVSLIWIVVLTTVRVETPVGSLAHTPWMTIGWNGAGDPQGGCQGFDNGGHIDVSFTAWWYGWNRVGVEVCYFRIQWSYSAISDSAKRHDILRPSFVNPLFRLKKQWIPLQTTVSARKRCRGGLAVLPIV
jgi:hypothetical protein